MSLEIVLEWAASIAPWLVGAMAVITIVMKTLKDWVDKNDKLKPYWFYIALGLSIVASVVTSLVMGNFAWTWVAWQIILAQFLMIFGGEYVAHTAIFKKVWPWVQKLWPVIKAIFGALKKKK